MVTTFATRAIFILGTLTTGAEGPAAVSGNSSAVITAVGGIFVALITSTALIHNNRISGAEERARIHKLEAQLWEARARLKGWSEDNP